MLWLSTRRSGEQVAVKLEPLQSKRPRLSFETQYYRVLSGSIGIPNVRWFGVEREFTVLVLDRLGPSLGDLFDFCGGRFSTKTVLMLAEQCLVRIENLHEKGLLHRDIKPENLLMGLGRRANQLYMIDFGLSRMYRDTRTHQHIPYCENKTFKGTARYASMNTHLGIEQGRRDDMESLGYLLLYLRRGSLPWQGLVARTKRDKYAQISEMKYSTPTETLCQDCEPEFATYINYCRLLRFDEKPDYEYCRKLFRDLFVRDGYAFDYIYDWTMIKHARDAEKEREAAKHPRPATLASVVQPLRVNYHQPESLASVTAPQLGTNLNMECEPDVPQLVVGQRRIPLCTSSTAPAPSRGPVPFGTRQPQLPRDDHIARYRARPTSRAEVLPMTPASCSSLVTANAPALYQGPHDDGSRWIQDV